MTPIFLFLSLFPIMTHHGHSLQHGYCLSTNATPPIGQYIFNKCYALWVIFGWTFVYKPLCTYLLNKSSFILTPQVSKSQSKASWGPVNGLAPSSVVSSLSSRSSYVIGLHKPLQVPDSSPIPTSSSPSLLLKAFVLSPPLFTDTLNHLQRTTAWLPCLSVPHSADY